MSGLRERNKVEKRRRIIDATMGLLVEKGFEHTTTREIAERAGVAAGTIFLYSQDKLDLVLMSVTEDLDALTERALQDVADSADLVDQLGAFFRPRFEFWAQWPAVSRIATHEMAASTSPSMGRAETARGIKRRSQSLAALRDILHKAQSRKRLTPDADIDSLARIILYLYLAELRFWLEAEHPRAADAVRKIKKLLSVALSGVTP